MAGRIHNLHSVDGGALRHCEYCCDDGIVYVGQDGYSGTDQCAPCPMCEHGFRVEFGSKEASSGRRPWGIDGYWRGRPTTGLEKTCACHVPRDPEAGGKMRALMKSVLADEEVEPKAAKKKRAKQPA